MNRGGVGARALNLELQAAMNPAGERKVERFGWTFAPGDKVMQVENDYDKEVYNGDIGFVEDVDSEAGDLTARFDGRSVTYGPEESRCHRRTQCVGTAAVVKIGRVAETAHTFSTGLGHPSPIFIIAPQ
jgi:hypothetical protein